MVPLWDTYTIQPCCLQNQLFLVHETWRYSLKKRKMTFCSDLKKSSSSFVLILWVVSFERNFFWDAECLLISPQLDLMHKKSIVCNTLCDQILQLRYIEKMLQIFGFFMTWNFSKKERKTRSALLENFKTHSLLVSCPGFYYLKTEIVSLLSELWPISACITQQ